MTNHEKFIAYSIELAARSAQTQGGGPFGALITKGDLIVGEGMNRVTGDADPTAHAEVNAIRAACDKLQTHILKGCVLYTSCEPCPMCMGAILWARIDAVYFSADRKLAAKHHFDDSHFYNEVTKPFTNRQIQMVHLPVTATEHPFDIWDANLEKVHY